MHNVNVRILFVCALFITKILAMETNITDNQGYAVAKNHFIKSNKHIHQLIFRYLNLNEQGIYSGLNKTFYEKFRKIFLVLLTHQLVIGLSPAFRKIEHLAVNIGQTVSILEEDILKKRSLTLKNHLNEFNYYVHLFTKSKLSYTPEEHDIMSYVKVLMEDKKALPWITYIDQSIWCLRLAHRIVTDNDATQNYDIPVWIYKYNLQNQTLYSSFKTKECIITPCWTRRWTRQAKFAMPLYIHYLLDGKDHLDVLAEYPVCDFTVHKEGSDDLNFISNAKNTSTIDGYPKIHIIFHLNKLLNDIVNVGISVSTWRSHLSMPGHASYIVKDGNLILRSGNENRIKIKSITTSNSFLTVKQNKPNSFISLLEKVLIYTSVAILFFHLGEFILFQKF